MNDEYQLDVRDLSLKRGGKRILRDVSFRLLPGEVLLISGPSGSGKSTLLRTLNRLMEPPIGCVFLDGEDITKLPVLPLRRRIGMVFQEPALFEGTVRDNINYGVQLMGGNLENEKISKLLESVTLDSTLMNEGVTFLSGGEGQRVALARALATSPDILLLDEPTSALDPHATRQVEETLLTLNRIQGLTLIWVSHSVEQVERIGGEVLLMREGQVIDKGQVTHLFDPQGHHYDALAFAEGKDIHKET